MGLLTFVSSVQTKLTELGSTAKITVGRTKPSRQDNQGPGTANRIVYVPKGGAYGAAMQPGRNPRPLHTLHENLDVYVWARGTSNPPTEQENYAACWDLKELLMIAMRRVGYGTYKLGSLKHPGPNEKINGWEMVFDMQLQVPVLDLAIPTVEIEEIDQNVILVDQSGNVIGP